MKTKNKIATDNKSSSVYRRKGVCFTPDKQTIHTINQELSEDAIKRKVAKSISVIANPRIMRQLKVS